jgi:hypothetical protein
MDAYTYSTRVRRNLSTFFMARACPWLSWVSLENLGRGVATPCLMCMCWFYDGYIVLWFSNEENNIIYISSRINLLYDGSHDWYGDFVGSYSFRIYVEKNDSITTVAFAFICDCELI